MRALLRRLLILLLAPVLAVPALGDAMAQTALPGDPPARVGRLGHVEGQVSLRTPDQDDWAAAALNYPVSTGLALWTEPDARAEVSYGEGAIRLDNETAVAVERLDDAAFYLRLDQGSVQLSVRQLGPRERVAIATPQGRMEALAPGTYRIDAGTGETPAGVTVLDGKARFSNENRSIEAVGGESAIVKEDGSLGTVAAIRRPFDDWALARESEVRAATVTPRHVPRAMPGHEDLERHGHWTETPEYGAVWYPAAVPAGWAPYRYGHWAWVHPWGWTWIDDAPWGFAPFHYGRWAHYHGRWCWVPGRYARYRPVYAPALVAFVGGSNFSIGISVGRSPAIGWVPLGPREVYYPHYRSSVTYVRNVNVVHVNRTVINNINVTNIKKGPPQRDATAFVNRRAATVVPVDAMRRAEPVHRAASKHEFAGDDLKGARPTTNLAALQPSRAARAGFETNRDSDGRGPDRAAEQRPAPRQASPGRPVTSDPDRLPTAPGPRREAKATPERGPQARPGPEGAVPDRVRPERRGRQSATPTPPTESRAAPQPNVAPRTVPDRTEPDRRGPQGATPAPSAPVQGRTAPQLDAAPRAAPDGADPDRRAPQRTAPPAQGRTAPQFDASPRAAPDRGGPDREQSRERAAPAPRTTAPSGPPAREQAPRREPQDREGQPQRPQAREPATPAPRSEATERTPMPAIHGPGQDQRQRTAPAARAEPPRPAAPNLSERQRPDRPTVHAPRPARIESPRMEQQRLERARPESLRPESTRVEQPRMERRVEQPRTEQRAAPQAQRQPDRRESPRQACAAGADCSR